MATKVFTWWQLFSEKNILRARASKCGLQMRRRATLPLCLGLAWWSKGRPACEERKLHASEFCLTVFPEVFILMFRGCCRTFLLRASYTFEDSLMRPNILDDFSGFPSLLIDFVRFHLSFVPSVVFSLLLHNFDVVHAFSGLPRGRSKWASA